MSWSGEKAFQVSHEPELAVSAVFALGSTAPHSTQDTFTLRTLSALVTFLRCCPLPSTVSFLCFSFLGSFRPRNDEAQGMGALGSFSVPLFFSPSLKMGTTENSRPSKRLPDPKNSVGRGWAPCGLGALKTAFRGKATQLLLRRLQVSVTSTALLRTEESLECPLDSQL